MVDRYRAGVTNSEFTQEKAFTDRVHLLKELIEANQSCGEASRHTHLLQPETSAIEVGTAAGPVTSQLTRILCEDHHQLSQLQCHWA
ncbi:hypothetical protein RRG08_046275 [Elysia crispata]|uniref:Uncharacterized protein n=1 Tax=Elysia crispata TaxID=231223 RepID=A0AAE0YL06_9GAST|nr:hypothetical protein RRG08_046275 [Elysia crispata]